MTIPWSRSLRPFALMLIVGFTILEVVMLSPSSIESPDSHAKSKLLDPADIKLEVQEFSPKYAVGYPNKTIPEYMINDFNYLSTQNGIKLWKLSAKKAFLWDRFKMVFSKAVTAYLHNPEQPPTIITGEEAKFRAEEKNLEIFGNVTTTFPDGFQIESDYVIYLPNSQKIMIPDEYKVEGKGKDNEGKDIDFTARGLDFDRTKNTIQLHRDVLFSMAKKKKPGEKANGIAEKTTIKSDQATIFRNTQLSFFKMHDSRELKDKFVNITQPGLFVKGRTANLRYGDFDKYLHYLTVHEDVYIEEKSEEEISRTATCGEALFDTRKDIIVLKKFPQVYQDRDTVTGEVILIHRDTDIVEVEYSNAFSRGDSIQTPYVGTKDSKK